jgi:hypothetical protein
VLAHKYQTLLHCKNAFRTGFSFHTAAFSDDDKLVDILTTKPQTSAVLFTESYFSTTQVKTPLKNVTNILLPYQPSIHVTDMVNMLVSCEARQNSEKRKNKPHIHNVSW